jgi:hypothetical protein
LVRAWAPQGFLSAYKGAHERAWNKMRRNKVSEGIDEKVGMQMLSDYVQVQTDWQAIGSDR